MKRHLGNFIWIAVTGLVAAGLLFILKPQQPDNAGLKIVADARQLLREQGFKTDLADFDFSTSPELRAREAVLKAPGQDNRSASFVNHPNLMEIIGNDSAVVVWQENSLKRSFPSRENYSNELSWDEFRKAINVNQAQVDAARDVILSGSIAFNLDSSRGDRLLFPHLAAVKKLAQTLGSRIVLDLHDGHPDAAWTNLLATTRLVAAWKPEPTEISHLVRFGDAAITFNATWQALQSHNWPDDKLARLQAEWESVNFLTNLPETTAFTRASAVAAYEFDRQRSIRDDYTFMEFCMLAIHFPPVIFSELTREWKQHAYSQNGSYEDEKGLLLFYRDREVEVRNATQAATWAQMRQLPGVTNPTIFQSPHSSRMQTMMHLRQAGIGRENQGSVLLRRAAESEARRRILVTAIALERYHGKRGSYPNSLADLAPEFVPSVPLDFMDGQPLRYRFTDDSHFILYSVGLDGVDNGGKMRRSWRETGLDRPPRPGTPEAEFDLVWPRPNSDAAMQEEQQIQTEAEKTKAKVKELRQKEYLKDISAREWEQSLLRQSRVATILATNWSDPPEGPAFNGQSVQSLIGNVSVSGTNTLSLCALLTPKQIITGKEPEDITFEFPIRYDAITNNNILFVNVDGDPEEVVKFDSGGKVYDRERAANGDCLVVWHAIFDPPGRHAVQVYVVLEDKREGRLYMSGPPVAVTTSNLCQFSLDCVNYDADVGARFHARLPEKNGNFSIECVTTNGAHLTTLTGSTTNGEFNVVWNLVDDHGQRLHGETFNTIVHITLPDSGRTQTLKGP